MTKWIKCSDRLPDIVNETILISDCQDVFAGFFSSNHEWHMSNGDLCDDIEMNVTHWQPMPDAPESE